MPSVAKRIRHKGRNIWKRATKSETAEFVFNSFSTVLFGVAERGINPWKTFGLEKIGLSKGFGFLAKQSWSAFSTMVSNVELSPLIICLSLGILKEEGGKILLKETISLGSGTPVNLIRDKVVMSKLVIPALKSVAHSSDDQAKERITKHHVLDFQRERAALGAHWTEKKNLTNQQKALNEAAKETEQLFLKISRHFMNAWNHWFKDVYPKLEKFEQHKGEPGNGLTGCRDSYKHLRSLYEFQHELDKSQRYLMAALSVTYHLRAWEGYLSTVEKEIMDTLENSVGVWIKEGDHSNCLRKKPLQAPHCYGPGEEDSSQPVQPMRDRPPATPAKVDHLEKKIVIKNADLKKHSPSKGKPLPPPPSPKK